MKKLILGLTLAAATSAMAVSATRIGPVSTYGELKANGGKLSGSCPAYANKAVQVKGMSLFWSSGNTYSTDFYSEKGINRLVDDMGVEVVRFAMGAADDKFNSSGRSYTTGGEGFQKALLKSVVNAAIEKDIYVIIDWHIESSTGFTDDAVSFFEYAAKEYGSYNNVIFEIWNEPTGDMGTVKSHADRVIPAIRKYSDNLILVGSPGWSSQPDACANAGISDKNYGCTLHFYAASHYMGGYDKAAETAMSKGVPVFATEWGTVNANGDGQPDENSSNQWIQWMAQKGVSWTNWNASAMSETSAAFANASFDNGFTYTNSGKYVKSKLGGATYSDCGLQNGNASASSGFSTGIANGTKTSMIDDMEDGDRYNYIGGAWSAIEDQENGGATTISNSKITDDFGKETYNVIYPSDGGKNTSKYMAALKDVKIGKGSLSYGPYTALILNLKKDTTVYADFANCKTIKYKYKGASHNFRIETTDVTDYNYHRVNKDASGDWKEVEITIDMLKQETWGNDAAPQKAINLAHANRIAWEIKGLEKIPDDQNQPKYPYLYVDDVSCDGLSFTASTEGASAQPASSSSVVTGKSSSSSVVASSSSVVPASSASVKTLILIDDVEDGDEVLKTTGTWYAYTDNGSKGQSSFTNAYDATLGGYVVTFPGTTDPTNGTQGFVGLTGIVWNQGQYTEAPFVAIGFNVKADTLLGLDMSQCSGISYRYKGAEHLFKVQDGNVTDWAFHESLQYDSENWKTVVLEWDEIAQPTWTQDPKDLDKTSIKKMSWDVVGYKGFDIQPKYNYLYVDDVVCFVKDQQSIKASVAVASSIKISAQGTNLNVTIAKAGMTRVQVFDMMGHVVANISENMTAGTHQVSLDNLSRGNYMVRVMSGSEVKTSRIAIK
ncbi:MAG: cellulase family glycosylhydrolase [Fibrobacter sp.]|nr:cellulase family glycosylhydrolase [Fibrobacter sp.]